MDPVIVATARKHGVNDDDMLHAYRNPIRVFDLDDLVMLIGADEAGRGARSRSAWRPVTALSSSFMPCPPARDS